MRRPGVVSAQRRRGRPVALRRGVRGAPVHPVAARADPALAPSAATERQPRVLARVRAVPAAGRPRARVWAHGRATPAGPPARRSPAGRTATTVAARAAVAPPGAGSLRPAASLQRVRARREARTTGEPAAGRTARVVVSSPRVAAKARVQARAVVPPRRAVRRRVLSLEGRAGPSAVPRATRRRRASVSRGRRTPPGATPRPRSRTTSSHWTSTASHGGVCAPSARTTLTA